MTNEQSIKDWFVAEVRERMDDLGLRPYHMAYFCRMNHNSIHTYLHGASLPNLWVLVLMAEHLDCCVNDLLGFDEVDDPGVFEMYKASTLFYDEKQFAGCFADRIQRYMHNRDITIEELSRRSDISVTTIKRWLSKYPRLPRTSDFLRICDALDCTPSELLGY